MRPNLQVWSHLRKKSLMEILIFYAVQKRERYMMPLKGVLKIR